MGKRWLLSGLAAGAVLLVSGAAFSGNQQTTLDQLQDFDQQLHVLWAYPQGQQIPQDYQHSQATVHLLANLAKLHPPEPCFPLVLAWDFQVRWDQHHGTNSTAVFEFLLTLMSALQCSAEITSASGSPPPMISIQPTAP